MPLRKSAQKIQYWALYIFNITVAGRQSLNESHWCATASWLNAKERPVFGRRPVNIASKAL